MLQKGEGHDLSSRATMLNERTIVQNGGCLGVPENILIAAVPLCRMS